MIGDNRRYCPTEINNRILVKDDRLNRKNCYIQDKVILKELNINSPENWESNFNKSHKVEKQS